jgi:hypothetical protein
MLLHRPFSIFQFKNFKKLDICPSSQQFHPDKSYDSQYTKNIQNFVKQRVNKILASQCRRLIIVDDGGELIEVIQHLVKNGVLPSTMEIIGVEQTSSGFRKLQGSDLIFPVVNVARSDAKLYLESSIIADSIIKNLWKDFSTINFKPTRALILGRGAIGAKIEKQLSSYCSVDSFDPIKRTVQFNLLNKLILNAIT